MENWSFDGLGDPGGAPERAIAVDSIYRNIPVRRGPIHALIICGIILMIMIAGGTAAMIYNSRDRALRSSERELANTSLLLARHFDQRFSDFIAVLGDVAAQVRRSGLSTPDSFKREMSTDAMHDALAAKIVGSSDIAGINVFDASGNLINSSDSWPIGEVNIADRAFFQELQSDAAPDDIAVELVRGRVSGQWSTMMARKITGPDGRFLGFVSRGLSPEQVERFFQSVALGDSASIALLDRDGTMLARYPHLDAMVGRNFRDSSLYRKVLSQTDHGTLRYRSMVDGEQRLASARHLSHFPISVAVTTTVAAALADWWELTKFLVFVSTLIATVIGVVLLLIVRDLIRQFDAARRQLDTAINNMTQGLVLYDGSARVVLTNRRYIEMYGLSPDVVRPGCHFFDVMRHRKEVGSFSGDVEQFCAKVLHDVAQGTMTHKVLETRNGRAVQIVNKPLPGGGWVATMEDVTERRRAEEKIAHLAHFDALTDLPNRVLFREHLDRMLARARDGEGFALIYIDIDEFKGINDSLGHQVGDELLRAIAIELRHCVGADDFVARLGGDEFAVVLASVSDVAQVTSVVERLHQSIRQPHQCLGHHLVTDASIGIAFAPRDGAELDQLIRHADLAMYSAKADGRRACRFFEPAMDASAKARRELEQDLREAIVRGEFDIHYQPFVDLASSRISGCEALLRWRHPVRGMVSPAEFIPVAEDTGLINEISDWVIATACAEAVRWPSHMRLAVNVSPVQFEPQTLALKVAAALAQSGLPAGRLELEITEAVVIRDDDVAARILHQLRDMGVRIALDDFGTGYSSLSYLQRFPFDKIKIDRSFVRNLGEPASSASIIQAVVNIAAARQMTTTAEGVETEAQRDLLRRLGCTEMQGFLVSAAVPADAIRGQLRVDDPFGAKSTAA
ncbi:MAG: EAL domain-containing protein [Xanthobacteraceae bacterium]|nr:EAL domain-containing protein [Xanthobacteraceae bacterium]